MLLFAYIPPLEFSFVTIRAIDVITARYVLYYFRIEQPGTVGVLAGELALLCYLTALQVYQYHSADAWKPAIAVNVLCWIMQFIGHGYFERRAPALLDNTSGATMAAPLFVLMDVMFAFGYRPRFQKTVNAMADENIRQWQQHQQKASSS